MKLKIKELREEFGLTQKELANKLSNTQRNISNWENGVSEPDCETILKIADLFEVSLDELFYRENIPQSAETINTNRNADLYRKINMLTSEQRNAIIALIDSFEKY